MLQPRPNPELEKTPVTLQKKPEHRERLSWRARIRKTLAVTALVTSPWIAAYAAEATGNYVEATEASAQVDEKQPPLDDTNAHSAVVILNGLGTNNANILASHHGDAIRHLNDGALWSINYNSAPLDPASITEAIVEKAEETGTNEVSIVGWSAGGVTGLDSAEDIILDTNIRVPLITLALTPDGRAGLLPASEEGLAAANVFSYIPGATYSTPLRFVLEMAGRSGWYDDGDFSERWDDFWDTWNRTADAIDTEELPKGQLIVDQALAIAHTDIRQKIVNIGNAGSEKLRPVILYIMVDDPKNDTIVDNEVSSENIRAYADEAGLEYFVIRVPDIRHSVPSDGAESLLEATIAASPEIQAAIAREQSLFELHNQHIYVPIAR